MQGRLLPLTVGSPTWNMSVDQAILESTHQDSLPTLRFYGWMEPSLSLGYFQNYVARQSHMASQPATCVRRSTGGGAILHDHELTYCLVMPMRSTETKKRQTLYRKVHEAFVKALASFSVRATPFRLDGRAGGDQSAFLCFQRRTDEDLIVSGYKVLGSAQRRTREAALQHGSLLLATSRFAPELPGICDLTSQRFEGPEMIQPVQALLGELTGIHWGEGNLTDQERENAQKIDASRYGSASWLQRR